MYFDEILALALELKTNSLLILRKLEYDIPVDPNYEVRREYDLANSVKFGTFSGIINVAALSKAINYNVQHIYSVISNVSVKREHLHRLFRLHSTRNEVISIMWLYTAKSPL